MILTLNPGKESSREKVGNERKMRGIENILEII